MSNAPIKAKCIKLLTVKNNVNRKITFVLRWHPRIPRKANFMHDESAASFLWGTTLMQCSPENL